MINFIIGLYRNPKPGSMCWVKTRWEPCISGDPRYIVSSILLACALAVIVVIVGLVIDIIRGRI